MLSRSSDCLVSHNDLRKSKRRKVQPWEIFNKVDEAVEVRMLCRTSNWEVVQFFIDATMEFARNKTWDSHKCITEVKGTRIQSSV